MMRPAVRIGLAVLLLASCEAAAEGSSPPRLGNAQLELRFVQEAAGPRLAEIVNKRSGRTLSVGADEFRIDVQDRAPLRPSDFRYLRGVSENRPDGRRLRLEYEGVSNGLALAIVYELNDRDAFARRRLELTTTQPLPLREVEVWRVAVAGACTYQEEGAPFYLAGDIPRIEEKKGFGLPVLLDDTFWGVEAPTAYNRYEQGAVSLRQHPGRTETNRFVSKSAVLGVAAAGQAAPTFLRYVESFQATPADRVCIGFNSWTTLMPPTEKNCLEFIDLLRRKLYEPHGVRLDFFGLDDGWDNKGSLWDYRKDLFPAGFAPLVRALEPMPTRLGLWMPPSSGYGHAGWCGQQGYARNPYWDCVCQSDPNYRRDMLRVATGYRQQHGLGYFKLDGLMTSCDVDRHPWHLGGDFAREANADAAEELFAAMRAADHPVYLDPTSGMWLSPWWLRTADSLWPNLYDGEAPAAAPAANFRESSTTSRDAQFRLRCRQNPCFPPYAMETLDIYQPGQPLGYNDAMATLARGQRLINLYADLRRFSDQDWAFLAAGFTWARSNAHILCRTAQLPGDPLKGEAYGLAHFRGARGILSLRNPSLLPQALTIRLDAACGWLRDELPADARDFVAEILYPRRETLPTSLRYGDVLTLTLQPFEQMVVRIDPDDGAPRICGAPARETARHERQAEWEIGGGADLLLRTTNEPISVRCDGQPVQGVTRVAEGWRIPRTSGGTADAGRLESALPAAWPSDQALTGVVRAVVAPGAKASLVLLCRAPADRTSALRCEAKLNGKAAAVQSFGPHLNPPHKLFYREFERQYWRWFEISVPAGTSEIAVAISGPTNGPAVSIALQGALNTELELPRAMLAVEFRGALPPAPAEPLPLPVAHGVRRTALTAVAPDGKERSTR